MKHFYLLIAALLIVTMTSMILKEKNDSQLTKSSEIGDIQPMFHKGMITIKVNEGTRELGKQSGKVSLNIPSLDLKVKKYEVDLLEKKFKYNPENLKKGMPDLSRIYRIEFPEKYPVTKVAREFSKDPNIEYAEPIPVNYLLEIPNDAMYGDLHHLPQIMADSAWEIHKGEDGPEDVVVAIVDSGVEWDHEDLVDNIWQNMGEDFDGDGITILFDGNDWIFDPDDENGIDDDGNGFIDDFIGWNFYNSTNDPNPISSLFMWEHGTICAGLASATTNNSIGVASISWNLKILALQGGWDNYINQTYNAIIYAAENGADVISNSWGNYGFHSIANQEAIDYAISLGSIIVAGTANDNKFKNMYPASYPGVISVGAVNKFDIKASYSNFGPHVKLSAPGGDGGFPLLTTYVNNSYSSVTGTSCATPIVAGLFGLVKSYNPTWSTEQVITQVLGTADDIDYLSPGYENLMGVGRINAYRALKDTSVSLPQEISIDLYNLTFQDSDGNNKLEPGDTASLNLVLRNYNYGVGADNATFTLISSDPDVIVLNNTITQDVPADDYFTLEDAFEFTIGPQATTRYANLKLITTSNVEITWGDEIDLKVMIAPQGILVFQGEGTGSAYSGDYINEFLVDQGHQVYYTSHFPSSLNGFDVAYLSYGNPGPKLRNGTPITMEMIQTMADYLMNSGRIYIESGSFFGGQVYYSYPDIQEIMELFGVAEVEMPLLYNPIDTLSGLPASICNNLIFEGSGQGLCWMIDKMTASDNGIAALEEDGYGTVAVQGEGDYGQRTFCFNYALGLLTDGNNGTRDELLAEITEYLLLGVGEEEFISENKNQEISVFPNPFKDNMNIHFTLNTDSYTRLEIIDLTGNQVAILCDKSLQSGDYTFSFNGDYLSRGIYICCLRTNEHMMTKKIIKR